MADNAQKTPLVESLNRFVDDKQASHEQLMGKRLPASVVSIDETGTIVTVKFEIQSDVITIPNVTCPLAGTEWTRLPIQAGTKGYVVPADLYMGGMSGLGGGVASFDQLPNLSNAVFLPVGNAEFEDTDDPNWHVIIGPDGVLLRTQDSTVSLLLTKDGGIELNGPLGQNLLKGNWTEATDDADAKSKGIPLDGVYKDPDGYLRWQRIP